MLECFVRYLIIIFNSLNMLLNKRNRNRTISLVPILEFVYPLCFKQILPILENLQILFQSISLDSGDNTLLCNNAIE